MQQQVLKTYTGKITSYRILIKCKRHKCILIHDDDFRRIAILNRPLKLFFLAFCGVIYQNLLHRRVYIAISSQKLLFHQFCEKPLHITFKTCPHHLNLCRCFTVYRFLVFLSTHDTALYPLWESKMSASQRVVVLCGWGVKAHVACLQVKLCVAISERLGKYYSM